jgi:hypothetical protein
MANPHHPRGRISRLVRRRIVGHAAVPMRGARQALIVRWIGAAAEKRRRDARQASRALPADDNVIRLAWGQTFGRAMSRPPRHADFPAELLAIRPRAGILRASAPV